MNRTAILCALAAILLLLPGMMNVQATQVGVSATPDTISFFFTDVERGMTKSQVITLTNTGELAFTNVSFTLSFQLQAYVEIHNVHGILNPQQSREVEVRVFIPAYSGGMALTGKVTVVGTTANEASASISTTINVSVEDFNGALSASSSMSTYSLTDRITVYCDFRNTAGVMVTTADIQYTSVVTGVGSFIWNTTMGKYTMSKAIPSSTVTNTYMMNITTYFAGKHYSASVSFDITGITPDYAPPVISMMTLTPLQPMLGQNITVSAHVVDVGSGVASVVCEIYVPIGGFEFGGHEYNYTPTPTPTVLYRSIPMMREMQPGMYSVVINPAQHNMVLNTTYTFKIKATDIQGNTNTTLVGSIALSPNVAGTDTKPVSGVAIAIIGAAILLLLLLVFVITRGSGKKGGGKVLGGGKPGGFGFGGQTHQDDLRDRIAANYPEVADRLYGQPPPMPPRPVEQPAKRESMFHRKSSSQSEPTGDYDMPPFDDEGNFDFMDEPEPPTYPQRGGGKRFI